MMCSIGTNGILMKGEHQAIIHSVQECLPLNRKMGHVVFHKDPARHESITCSNQLMFVEIQSQVLGGDLINEESMFQRHGEIGKQGLNLDHHPLHHAPTTKSMTISFSAMVRALHNT